MTNSDQTLQPLVRKLELWQPLDAPERAALLALPYKRQDFHANQYLVREGDRPDSSCLLLEGLAYRQKLLVDGSRSICAIQMKGDVVDLQNSLLGTADHSVQALTACKVAYIPRDAIKRITLEFPAVGLAMWYDTLVDGSIFREWIANIARRDARARMAHLLCEFGVRFESVGLGERQRFVLPATQEQLADAVGLTPVHVNRTLKSLEQDGLIARRNRTVSIADWNRISEEAGFDSAYLHLAEPPPQPL